MSTRATYKIEDQTFYIHHDGYEMGASTYFANMIEKAGNGIQFVEAFQLGNDRAEKTESHEAHGDTEYCYDLKGFELTAYELDWDSNEPKQIFKGRLIDFIIEHGTFPSK